MKRNLAFERIKAGLDDAIAFSEGDSTRGKIKPVRVRETDVVVLRKRLGLTQARFADIFGVNLKTIRNWEQGIRRPEGPARILLQVIDAEPEAVFRALR